MHQAILTLALLTHHGNPDARAALALAAASRPAQAPKPAQAPPARVATSCPDSCPCGCNETGVCTCAKTKAGDGDWVYWKRESGYDYWVKYAKPVHALPPSADAGANAGTSFVPATFRFVGGGACVGGR